MQTDIADLRPTIVPKSDQLNAEQLLGGPMTVTVTDVRLGSGEDQPVIVHYANDNGRPFKPCKTMRKLMIFGWGEDGRRWIGRSMTLYNDPDVKFGGMDVGGIRISHMTDIDPRGLKVSLTATKGKKALHTVKLMAAPTPPAAGAVRQINEAPTVEALKTVFGAAYKATKDPDARAALKGAYDARLVALTPPPPDKTLADFQAEVDSATDADVATLVLDEARDVLTPTELEDLAAHYRKRWEQ